ncbi:hypothetical protein T190820D02B_11260 [Tenacibaculum sp. 190524A05c]
MRYIQIKKMKNLKTKVNLRLVLAKKWTSDLHQLKKISCNFKS